MQPFETCASGNSVEETHTIKQVIFNTSSLQEHFSTTQWCCISNKENQTWKENWNVLFMVNAAWDNKAAWLWNERQYLGKLASGISNKDCRTPSWIQTSQFLLLSGLDKRIPNNEKPRQTHRKTHLGLFWESPEPNQPLSLPSDDEEAWLRSDLAGRESLLPPENIVFLSFFPLSGGESEEEDTPGATCPAWPSAWVCETDEDKSWTSLSFSLSSFFDLSKDQRRPSAKEPLSSLFLVRFCKERESGEHFSSRSILDGWATELFGEEGSESYTWLPLMHREDLDWVMLWPFRDSSAGFGRE